MPPYPPRRLLASLLLVLLTLLAFFAPLHPRPISTLAPSSLFSAPQQQKLHLLLPINSKADRKLFCRTLLSALVHGYDPVVLNWEVTGSRDELLKAKIRGLHQYLTSLPPSASNDLILLTDALDVWFQLPPSVLIERYRTAVKAGGGVEVITGAEKKCWPGDQDGPVCLGAPPSPLPKGVFGLTKGEEENYQRAFTRPRWANSGTVMGTVKTMEPLWKWMVEVLDDPEKPQQNDQGIFNELLSKGLITVDYHYSLFYSNFIGPPESAAFVTLPTPTLLNLSPSLLSTSSYAIPVGSPFDLYPHPNSLRNSFWTAGSGEGESDIDIIPFALYPTVFLHPVTAQYPALIHLNDAWNKDLLDKWWGKLWWQKSDRRFMRIVRSRLGLKGGGDGHGTWEKGGEKGFTMGNGTWIAFGDICPKALVDLTMTEDWTET